METSSGTRIRHGRSGSGPLPRPYPHPPAFPELADLQEVVTEAVVGGVIETLLADDGVDRIRLQPFREDLILQAPRRGDGGFEDLPHRVADGRLPLDLRIRQPCLGGRLVEDLDELR